jgi:hypothetical protein
MDVVTRHISIIVTSALLFGPAVDRARLRVLPKSFIHLSISMRRTRFRSAFVSSVGSLNFKLL